MFFDLFRIFQFFRNYKDIEAQMHLRFCTSRYLFELFQTKVHVFVGLTNDGSSPSFIANPFLLFTFTFKIKREIPKFMRFENVYLLTGSSVSSRRHSAIALSVNNERKIIP